MPETQKPVTQADVNRVAAKLTAFCDTLPEDERQIMRAILKSAEGPVEVSGFAAGPTIFFPPTSTGPYNPNAPGPRGGDKPPWKRS